MLEADKVFAGSIPENYDRYMVPLIFEPYAADIAQRAASLSPSTVLETAAGSGIITRALAPRLPQRLKAGICNRLRRIRDCGQTWPRRGRSQNSGTRNRGILNVGICPSDPSPTLAVRCGNGLVPHLSSIKVLV